MSDSNEDLEVHVDQTNEGEDSGGEGGVPDQRQRVPEDEVGVAASLARVHLVGAVVLGQGHLHELGRVESEGEHGDWDNVDQQPLAVAHCLKIIENKTINNLPFAGICQKIIDQIMKGISFYCLSYSYNYSNSVKDHQDIKN